MPFAGIRHSANSHCTVFHRILARQGCINTRALARWTHSIFRASGVSYRLSSSSGYWIERLMPFAAIRHSINGHRAVFDCILPRQGRVDARALARGAGCIDSVVVIVSNLCHKLRLENAAVAYRKARCLVVSIYHRHLEAIGLPVFQSKVHCRIAVDIGVHNILPSSYDTGRTICIKWSGNAGGTLFTAGCLTSKGQAAPLLLWHCNRLLHMPPVALGSSTVARSKLICASWRRHLLRCIWTRSSCSNSAKSSRSSALLGILRSSKVPLRELLQRRPLASGWHPYHPSQSEPLRSLDRVFLHYLQRNDRFLLRWLLLWLAQYAARSCRPGGSTQAWHHKRFCQAFSDINRQGVVSIVMTSWAASKAAWKASTVSLVNSLVSILSATSIRLPNSVRSPCSKDRKVNASSSFAQALLTCSWVVEAVFS